MVDARDDTHKHNYFEQLKSQNIQKTRLICIFWVFEDLSLMMENVLVNFEDTGYSFYFVSNFEVLKVTPDTVHGAAHTHTQLQLAFLSRKHTGNHLQQVSPFKLVGVHRLLKSCLVCIGRLGVKIVESFSVRMAAPAWA